MERLVPSQLILIALKKSSEYIVVSVHFPRSCRKCNTQYAAGVKVDLFKQFELRLCSYVDRGWTDMPCEWMYA